MARFWLYLLLLAVIAGVGVTLYQGLRSPAEGPATAPPGAEAAPSGASSCVACHRSLPQTFIGHTFADWADSPHAAAGVSCHDCHGGDPSAGGTAPAHRGVLPSRDPESRLYFTQIPASCGSCHAQELINFKESLHFSQLQETGRGPNCVTCHGSMAISIPQPKELSSTCAACHNERLGIRPDEPLKARYLLKLMQAARVKLELTRLLIRNQQGQADTAAAEALLSQAEEQLDQIPEKWHTFKLEQLEDRLDRVGELTQAALGELGVTGF